MGFNIAWLQKKVKIGKNDKNAEKYYEKMIGGKMKGNSVKKNVRKKR